MSLKLGVYMLFSYATNAIKSICLAVARMRVKSSHPPLEGGSKSPISGWGENKNPQTLRP